jgi:predicted MPP superfamily phosphohydrolase
VRVAALYDIHGMLEPLQAVVRKLEDEQFDSIVIGGDAISGPQPAETLELLRSLGTPMHWIRGNGERALGPAGVDAVIGDVADRLDDQRMRVPDDVDAEAAVEVDVLAAVDVPDARAMPAAEVHRVRVVRLEVRRHAVRHALDRTSVQLLRAGSTVEEPGFLALRDLGRSGLQAFDIHRYHLQWARLYRRSANRRNRGGAPWPGCSRR